MTISVMMAGVSCKQAPATQGEIVTLTTENFDSATATGVVLIDFYADWCIPCKAMKPAMNKVAYSTGTKALICRINIDNEPAIAQRFRIQSIPTLVFMKDGKETERITGLQPADNILNLLSKYTAEKQVK